MTQLRRAVVLVEVDGKLLMMFNKLFEKCNHGLRNALFIDVTTN